MFSLTSSRSVVVDFLSVAPDCRGRGLGSYLLKKLRSQPIGGLFNVIKVLTPGNPELLEFFHKNGFGEDSVLSMKMSKLSGSNSRCPRFLTRGAEITNQSFLVCIDSFSTSR